VAGRTTLTAGASHIMEARGTLGVLMLNSPRSFVPFLSTSPTRVFILDRYFTARVTKTRGTYFAGSI
jgi:hypothetical protein